MIKVTPAAVLRAILHEQPRLTAAQLHAAAEQWRAMANEALHPRETDRRTLQHSLSSPSLGYERRR